MNESHDGLDGRLRAAFRSPGPDAGQADLESARGRFLGTLQRRRRRRASLAGGAVLAVAVTLGALVAAGDLSGPSSTTTASPPTGSTAGGHAQAVCRPAGGAAPFACGHLAGATGAAATRPAELPVQPGTAATTSSVPGPAVGADTNGLGAAVPLRVGQVLTVTLPAADRLTGPATTTGGVGVAAAGRRELRITGLQAGPALVVAPLTGRSCPRTSSASCPAEVAGTFTIDLEVST